MSFAAALLAASGAALAQAPSPSAPTPTPTPVGRVLEEGEVQSKAVDELSGLAVSRADPTILWGHNDSGDGPNLYRIGVHGEDLGTVTIKGAQAGDWEDIAAFDQDGPALLIADTGDDFGLRAYGTLYAVRDPGRGGAAPLLWRLDFQFADGDRDCEAVAVDPLAHEILLVTKRDNPARIYRLPLPKKAPGERLTAEFVGTLPELPAPSLGKRLKAPMKSYFANMPTALSISADGKTAAIVTLTHAYVYRRAAGEPWAPLFMRGTSGIRLPEFKQIEAAALTPDGRELVVGSEGSPGRWARIELPPP